ncbi:MAG: NADH-ubiquinone oxidoreductase-F iron-sulfur binding region domain-containing protein [Patescibacteria group bacterium]|nr:NADH-ubiquinone oxidoreductase-F iron-sulfur binding region domain-containing protein [Patescibacteria group bacterium]
MWFTPKIIKKIEKAGLIGRGCNNFPVARKWEAVRKARGKEKFVICNISESEPGVFKDRHILRHHPERVIDGMILAMDTVGAKNGFIYLNPEYFTEFNAKLREIIDLKIGGIGMIELFEKPFHDYIGGDETALLNSLEGKRVEPRLKPPYPVNFGLEGKPTLINNCETFYAISLIAENKYKNTKFYSLSGAGVETAVKELPVDITVKKMLQEFDHEPSEKYFYQVGGGAAGTCYNFKQLNRKFDGLASVIIYSMEESPKNVVMKWLNFFEDESCGQCVPCREGTYRLRNLMRKYFETENLDKEIFDDLVFTLENTSFCALGKVSTNAVLSYLKNVRK